MEDVYQLFLSQASQEGVVTLEQFTPLVHVILQMIYKNSYPTQVRIEQDLTVRIWEEKEEEEEGVGRGRGRERRNRKGICT